MARTWGRLYLGTRNHRKIKTLRRRHPGSWKTFYLLLEMALETDDDGWIYLEPGQPYPLDELADEVDETPESLQALIDTMADLGMIHVNGQGLQFLSYSERQFKSDAEGLTDRVERCRRKALSNRYQTVTSETESQQTGNESVTPDTETETETETELENNPPIIPQTIPEPPADSDSKSSKPKSTTVPYQAVIDLWNAHAPEPLPRASLTDKRKPKIKAAWKEYPSLDWWRELFSDIVLSPWHSHRNRWQGNSFDWMLKNRTEMREKLNALKGNGQRESLSREPAAGVEPDPPGIMIPVPNCQDCGGSGLARDGPCECLHPENPDDPYWQEHPEKLTRFKRAKPTTIQTIGQA